ncbi:Asg1p NDAI_0B03850 [Naumovozyma dairenensis CBS 421]|uniref:Zn(2)-C6 fungal-type domain-containing protein n=1 Tax=Naumovozyma dairenensis (strain ATCC 10597 / BCRC 20456 / CBS 421 / NBRC 0211 / NRRL Y-12639) TaxID=1071378 RepID=G0W6K8_NAUDC|nr:hypothetical protein NDAI_0B03850 [Naumovozyma dairenensis CBS 421]CCD23419.1 hypothetical protein NDAI_0B03850 [Naumovozyma dairenensis CBS 421]
MSDQNNQPDPKAENMPQNRLLQDPAQQHMAKRRRVTRACDECRKKKVKCDGQQPCIHCTVYSYECTYNQPTKRSLQHLTTYAPSKTNNSSSSPLKQTTNQVKSTSSSSNIIKLSQRTAPPVTALPTSTNNTTTRKYTTKSIRLQSQLDRYKLLFDGLFPTLPDINNLDIPTFLQICHNFRENSSFIDDIVKEYFFITNDTTSPPQQSQLSRYGTPEGSGSIDSQLNGPGSAGSTNTFDLRQSDNNDKLPMGREIKIILPPKPIAIQFIKKTWEHCCVLLRIYHRPSFIKQVDELYETDPHNYSAKQMQFLPLCYSVIAVGALFSKSIANEELNHTPTDLASDTNPSTDTKFLQDEGYKYFIAARKLIDITSARSLDSIQAILMMFIFLQCSARLSTCYSYIGVAMRSALREGLHRQVGPNSGFNPIEIEMRKRLFYTIYKLDIYVNAMLGLPRSISANDFDQTLPLELSDENITEQGYFPENQNGVLSSTGIANEHTKLLMILDAIVGELYPIKKTNTFISHETIATLEQKLRNWLDDLPNELAPNLENIPPRYERANKLLHLSFLHVQIILYRPFIHYLSRNFADSNSDALSLQCARNSIKVARAVVRLAEEMLKKNLISGSYWYASYTIFYSVATLLFYIHEAELPDKESAREYHAILKDAQIGREVLNHIKDSSMAAMRTYNLLNKLFEKLNSKTIMLTTMHTSPPLKNNIVTNKENPITTQSLPQRYLPGYAGAEMKQPRQILQGEESVSSYSVSDYPSDLQPPIENELLAQPQQQLSTTSLPVNRENRTNFAPPQMKTFNTTNNSGLKTVNSANNFMKQNENPINNDPLNLSDIFGFNGNPDDILTTQSENLGLDNNTNNMDKNVEKKDNSTMNDKIKSETLDQTGILDVFDQLDAHLFGKYMPLNYPMDPQNEPQQQQSQQQGQ